MQFQEKSQMNMNLCQQQKYPKNIPILPMNNVKKVNKLKNYHVCCHTDHFVITCITSAILRQQRNH